MASSRSWLKRTEPISFFRAHLATGNKVDLSEISTVVGRKRSSASITRHGSVIRR